MLSLGNQVLLRKRSDRLVTRNRQDAGIDHHSAKLTGVIGPQVGNQPVRALGGLECWGMGSHAISQGLLLWEHATKVMGRPRQLYWTVPSTTMEKSVVSADTKGLESEIGCGKRN
jgi:hypothetical protein